MRKSNSGLVNGAETNPQGSLEQEDARILSINAKESLVKFCNSKRDELLAKMKTPKGKSIINELYRPGASVGNGGTADKLIDETINGVKPGDKGHYQKAKDRVREIEKVLKNGVAKGDESILLEEKDRLIKAIEYWEKKYGK